MPRAFEVNFDGLVGPTHNYSGLSVGNRASTSHKNSVSNPKEAVLQGLEKMKNLYELGFKQGIFLPQERPDFLTARRLGFNGSDKTVLTQLAKASPSLLSSLYSASSMWTANAATMTPSADSTDGRVHFTPANLVNKFHRFIESDQTSLMLKKIFKNPKFFCHHDVLPGSEAFGDEGAANHTRLCDQYDQKGVAFFVYGRTAFLKGIIPKNFPARQTLEASMAVAKQHGLAENAVIYAQQNPNAIDAGVFHNDVAAVGNRNFYFYHEHAYLNSSEVIKNLKTKFRKICGGDLLTLQVPAKKVTLKEAVKSYLFNSQLLSLENDKMLLIAPSESQKSKPVSEYLCSLLKNKNQPITEVKFFDLRQSMKNGGGPACLRLRVVLNEDELQATHQRVLFSLELYDQLVRWAKKHYRDRLSYRDLLDPKLITESRIALDELTQICGLGSFYPFQIN
jgi:succinylarginine dihydrolase